MRITLVYNPTAGDGVDQGELTKLLEAAGHVVRVVSRKGDWQKALKKPADLVVAVGGDGTFRQVALAVAKSDTPMADPAHGDGQQRRSGRWSSWATPDP